MIIAIFNIKKNLVWIILPNIFTSYPEKSGPILIISFEFSSKK